jgi:predicted nucleic acid-binding protein
MSEHDPARFVADADVLAADVLIDGPAREAIDLARAHDWVTLVASEPLLEDTEYVLEALGDAELAARWRDRMDDLVELVSHPEGDHPGLATAVAGDARHLLSLDDDLISPDANVALQGRVDVSIRHPEAFVSLFDPESMYEVAEGGTYHGPDNDPRD